MIRPSSARTRQTQETQAMNVLVCSQVMCDCRNVSWRVERQRGCGGGPMAAQGAQCQRHRSMCATVRGSSQILMVVPEIYELTNLMAKVLLLSQLACTLLPARPGRSPIKILFWRTSSSLHDALPNPGSALHVALGSDYGGQNCKSTSEMFFYVCLMYGSFSQSRKSRSSRLSRWYA